MIRLLFHILPLLFLASCYRDTRTHPCAYENPVDLKNECRDVVEYMSGPNNTFGYNKVGLHQYGPSFNPNNANELAYVLHPLSPDNMQAHLVVYDLASDQHQFIGWMQPDFSGTRLEWSTNGYIFIASSDAFVNPVSGDVIFLQNDLLMSSKRWAPNGDKMLGWIARFTNDSMKRYWDKHYPDYKMAYLTWPEREIVPVPLFKDMDVLPQSFAWSSQNEIVYDPVGTQTQYITNVDQFEEKVLFTSDVKIGKGGGDYEWSPDGNTLYFANSHDGIFTITKGENRQHRIKKGCPNRQYGQIAISPNGDKLVAQRRDIEAERDGSYISETTRLVIMDINGCNERILFENWDGHVEGRP